METRRSAIVCLGGAPMLWPVVGLGWDSPGWVVIVVVGHFSTFHLRATGLL